MRTFSCLAGTSLALLAVPVVAAEADSGSVQLEAMSCKALSKEVGRLEKRQAKARRQANGGGGSFFKSLNRVALPMLDSVVSETGGATMDAADGARQGLRSAEEAEAIAPAATPDDRAAAAAQTEQRLETLRSLLTSREC